MQGHKEVEWLLTGNLMTGINSLLFASFTNIVGSCSPVVAISNIGIWDLFKLCLEEGCVINGTFPENMSDTIITCDITVWGVIVNDRLDSCLDDLLVVSKGQKHRFSVGVLGINKSRPILLFLGKSKFMLFYQIVFIVINRSESEDALLSVSAKGLLINVHSRNIVFNQKSFLAELHKVLEALSVHFVIVWVQVVRQVDLRFAYVIEGHFVVFAFLCCFLSIHDVVSMRKNLADMSLCAKESLETAKFDH